MRNYSTEFKRKIYNDEREFLKYADITLADGTVLHLENDNFWENGFSFEDAVSGSGSFDIGSAIVNELTITINNIYDEFTDYVFDGAKIVAYIGMRLTNGIEKGRICTVTVVEAPYSNSSIIILKCQDEMYKFDRPYSESKLVYPATIGRILQDACECCDVQLLTTVFRNSDYVVDTRPDDDSITFREVVSWIAQLSVGWARCDEFGRLEIKWYDTDTYDSNMLIDGGIFDDGSPKYETGADFEGGNFSDYSSGESYDGGTFADANKFQHIYSTSGCTIYTNDVVITAIKVMAEETQTDENGNEQNVTVEYQFGKDGYALVIEGNKFIQNGKGEDVARFIGELMVGFRFRPFSCSCLGNPMIEAGDIVYITDRKQNTYKTLITNTTFSSNGYQSVSCEAKPALRNSATRYSSSTKAVLESNKEIDNKISNYDKTVQQITQLISQGFGMYMTPVKQEDGSVIYYMHDKPTIEESSYVCYWTSNGIIASLDGGTSWAVDLNGNALYNVLTARGINADWINTGRLVIKDEDQNVTFEADTKTGAVRIIAEEFSLRGKTIEEIAQEGLEDYADEIIAGAIEGVATQYFYAYDPTLNNLPASQWTTDEERDKHVNNIFYNTSTKKMFRFMKTGSTYRWESFEDPDIQKAMEEASYAKDTADGKRRVFVSTPYPPYDIGDLWVGNSNSDLMRCQEPKTAGQSYSSSDWIKAVKYTDDTIANNALDFARDAISAAENPEQYLTQLEIFNLLTGGGSTQGIYLSGGKLYVNASYIMSGILQGIQIIANSGRIGGFTISTNRLYAGNSSSGYVAMQAGTSSSAGAFAAGMSSSSNFSDAGFRVSMNGKMRSVGGEFEDVSISGGNIDLRRYSGGAWYGSVLGPDEFDIYDSVSVVVIEGYDGIIIRERQLGENGLVRTNVLSTQSNQYARLNGDKVQATGTKNRIVRTEDYNEVMHYCYETPSPYFGDIGCGETDSTGVCYVALDDIFRETVRTDLEYQVFLQKEGNGDLWISEKHSDYFVVNGTPNLRFSWEAKAKQRDYEFERLESPERDTELADIKAEDATSGIVLKEHNYQGEYEDEIDNYYEMQETEEGIAYKELMKAAFDTPEEYIEQILYMEVLNHAKKGSKLYET